MKILSGNKVARRIWDTQPEVHLHPDGDRRWMHLPYHEQAHQVEIVALSPLRAQAGLRLMMLVATDGADRVVG